MDETAAEFTPNPGTLRIGGALLLDRNIRDFCD